MRTRRLLAALLVVVVTLGACSYQTATSPTGPLTLYANFDDAQDLTAGHNVQMSSVVVGSVQGVSLDGYQARARLSIVEGRSIPTGTTAVIRRTSLLGEFYVDLVVPPDSDHEAGPFLENEGELVGSTQPDIEQLAQELVSVVGAVTAEDLTNMVRSGVEAFGGRGKQLNKMVDDAAAISEVIAAQHTDVERAIDATAQIVGQFAPEADGIGKMLEEVSKTTSVLAEDRDRMIAALSGLQELAATTDEVILRPHMAELERLYTNFRPVASDLASRSDVLADLIVKLQSFTEELPNALYNGNLLLLTWAHASGVPVLDPTTNGDPLMALVDFLGGAVDG